ncbi:hypothetical protein JCM3770_005235 [Rhodotorula araucariae]
MIMALRFALPLIALLPLAIAQLAADAPACAAKCFQAKIDEALSLAPGVQASDLAGLCSSATFLEAYQICLGDNCPNEEDTTAGEALGSQACAAATTSAAIDESASSTIDSLSSSASSVLESASSRADSIISTDVTATESGALTGASSSLSSSLASVSSSLASDVSSRAASITSSASNAGLSSTSKGSSSGSPTASGSIGNSTTGGSNSAPSWMHYSPTLLAGSIFAAGVAALA